MQFPSYPYPLVEKIYSCADSVHDFAKGRGQQKIRIDLTKMRSVLQQRIAEINQAQDGLGEAIIKTKYPEEIAILSIRKLFGIPDNITSIDFDMAEREPWLPSGTELRIGSSYKETKNQMATGIYRYPPDQGRTKMNQVFRRIYNSDVKFVIDISNIESHYYCGQNKIVYSTASRYDKGKPSIVPPIELTSINCADKQESEDYQIQFTSDELLELDSIRILDNKILIKEKTSPLPQEVDFNQIANENVGVPMFVRSLHQLYNVKTSAQLKIFVETSQNMIASIYKISVDYQAQSRANVNPQAINDSREAFARKVFDIKRAGDVLQIKYAKKLSDRKEKVVFVTNDRLPAIYAHVYCKLPVIYTFHTGGVKYLKLYHYEENMDFLKGTIQKWSTNTSLLYDALQRLSVTENMNVASSFIAEIEDYINRLKNKSFLTHIQTMMNSLRGTGALFDSISDTNIKILYKVDYVRILIAYYMSVLKTLHGVHAIFKALQNNVLVDSLRQLQNSVQNTTNIDDTKKLYQDLTRILTTNSLSIIEPDIVPYAINIFEYIKTVLDLGENMKLDALQTIPFFKPEDVNSLSNRGTESAESIYNMISAKIPCSHEPFIELYNELKQLVYKNQNPSFSTREIIRRRPQEMYTVIDRRRIYFDLIDKINNVIQINMDGNFYYDSTLEQMEFYKSITLFRDIDAFSTAMVEVNRPQKRDLGTVDTTAIPLPSSKKPRYRGGQGLLPEDIRRTSLITNLLEVFDESYYVLDPSFVNPFDYVEDIQTYIAEIDFIDPSEKLMMREVLNLIDHIMYMNLEDVMYNMKTSISAPVPTVAPTVIPTVVPTVIPTVAVTVPTNQTRQLKMDQYVSRPQKSKTNFESSTSQLQSQQIPTPQQSQQVQGGKSKSNKKKSKSSSSKHSKSTRL